MPLAVLERDPVEELVIGGVAVHEGVSDGVLVVVAVSDGELDGVGAVYAHATEILTGSTTPRKMPSMMCTVRCAAMMVTCDCLPHESSAPA